MLSIITNDIANIDPSVLLHICDNFQLHSDWGKGWICQYFREHLEAL